MRGLAIWIQISHCCFYVHLLNLSKAVSIKKTTVIHSPTISSQCYLCNADVIMFGFSLSDRTVQNVNHTDYKTHNVCEHGYVSFTSESPRTKYL